MLWFEEFLKANQKTYCYVWLECLHPEHWWVQKLEVQRKDDQCDVKNWILKENEKFNAQIRSTYKPLG
jgi:hypothetical protein